MDPVAIAVLALVVVVFALALGAAVVRVLRDRKGHLEPARAPVVVATSAAQDDAPRCPCGALATKPLPRARVLEMPIFGRVVRRERDAFGAPVVCDAHADVAATVIDERIALARLAEARAERDRITELANAGDVVGVVVSSLPEERQRAWRRLQAAAPSPVRVLRAANGGDEGAEGQGP